MYCILILKKSYLLLWSTQTFSALGSGMTGYAMNGLMNTVQQPA